VRFNLCGVGVEFQLKLLEEGLAELRPIILRICVGMCVKVTYCTVELRCEFMLPHNLDLLPKPVGKVGDFLSNGSWARCLTMGSAEHCNFCPVFCHPSHLVQ